MSRVVLVLFFATRVSLQPQSYQHEFYVAKQSRDNSEPVQTGYVFSQKDNNPATFETFGNRPNVQIGDGDGTPTRYSAISMNDAPRVEIGANGSGHSESLEQYPGMTAMHKHLPLPSFDMHDAHSLGKSLFNGVTESTMPYTTKSWTEHSINYEIAKAKSKFSVDPLMAIKTKSDIMQNRMKSLMHYSRPSRTLEDKTPRYDYNREFHIDADDVKSSSRNEYEWWPYFLHHPYEYEQTKIDSDIQKAKEKRYAVESAERVIPVHESHEDYNDGYGASVHSGPRYHRAMKADNPIAGDEPFLSFVLNDYFDKNADDDPLVFKGLEWGTDFDMNKHKTHNFEKRHGIYNDPSNYIDNEDHIGAQNFNAVSKSLAESATEKGYKNSHQFDNYEKGDTRKENSKADHLDAGDRRTHFKDFVDQFANKFGGEDHKRHSNFALKTNKDNAEKRKGFRRVYHKDEYQEDNEFFDNTGNSVKAEDSGSSTTHLGGSEAAVQSHAAATEGSTTNSFNNAGNSENNKFESSHIGHDNKQGLDRNFNKYIDVAKETAHSNIADYYDKFVV